MSVLKKLSIFFLIIAGSAFMTAILFFWLVIKTPQDPLGQNRAFKVDSGESAGSIAGRLERDGIIRSAFYFRLYTLLSLRHQALKRGEYNLGPQFSIRDIADTIFQGRVNEVRVTLPEGLNLKEIENLFISSGLIQKGGLENYALRDSAAFAVLKDKPSSAGLEGYLFPDTYNFYKDSSVDDVVRKMLSTLDAQAGGLLASKPKDKTIFQILTMASLIEKETKNDPDRQLVSGILWKRLEAGMPLQVDATLIYITGRREIYEKDKKIQSPYNTYMYRGLPKGPISNPGLAAIASVLNPKDSPYWYYLNSPDGKTIYSVTLEEHNRAKAIYLRASSKN